MFNLGMVSFGINLAPNCYAQWHVNESSGTNVPDTSGNSRNGTLQNTPEWVAGKLNNCLRFVGTESDYVNCGAIASFEGNVPVSYEFWFNTSTATQTLLMKYDSGAVRGMAIDLNSGVVYFLLASSISNYLLKQTNATFNDGAWHHCIITYSGSTTAAGVKFYVDGVLITATTTVGDGLGANTVLNSVDFSIGRTGPHGYCTGKLDEIVIYDKVLSLQEVQFRYNGGAGTENLK